MRLLHYRWRYKHTETLVAADAILTRVRPDLGSAIAHTQRQCPQVGGSPSVTRRPVSSAPVLCVATTSCVLLWQCQALGTTTFICNTIILCLFVRLFLPKDYFKVGICLFFIVSSSYLFFFFFPLF